jgi:hypothetical protein
MTRGRGKVDHGLEAVEIHLDRIDTRMAAAALEMASQNRIRTRMIERRALH